MGKAIAITALSLAPALDAGDACFIETGRLVLYAGQSDAIGRSDCPRTVRDRFNDLVRSAEGSVRADHLERLLAEEFGTDVSILPRRIEVHEAADYARKALSLPGDRKFGAVAFLDGKALLVPDGDAHIEVECPNCRKLGKKQIKMTVVGGGHRSATGWLKTEVSVKVPALVALRTLTFGGEALSADDFEKRDVYTTKPETVLADAKNVAFYKANKTILKGQVVSRSDLSPMRLVSPNRSVEIFYRGEGLFLRSKASPLKSGRYGESIQLRGRGNRTIIGRVVDYDKVVVEI